MSAVYCLIVLFGLIATYLFIIYLKEYSREEKSIKELLKAQDKMTAGMPMYFDIDPATAKELMKAYGEPATAKKTTVTTSEAAAAKTKKTIN
jgi:hypothetical protein